MKINSKKNKKLQQQCKYYYKQLATIRKHFGKKAGNKVVSSASI